MAELGFAGGGGARIYQRWLNWNLGAGELAPGFVRGRKGGNYWWTRRWDVSEVAELGFIGGHGAETPW